MGNDQDLEPVGEGEEEAPPAAEPGVFVSGGRIDRSGLAAYLHVVRAPDDPERTPRGKGRGDRAPHRTLSKRSAAEWEPVLLEALADGRARTFNRLGIELFDLTADVLFTTTVNDALWNLVERGAIEHTTWTPILFRKRAMVTDEAGQGLLFPPASAL